MKNSHVSLLSCLIVILFSTLCVALADSHSDNLFQCLFSHRSTSISLSPLTYTQINSTYQSVLFSSVQNLRPIANPKLSPLAIITPNHESQIQTIINCSKVYEIEIRIRSGGHDYEGLSYISNSTFIILDMTNLRSISIDIENKNAWVQSGATLGELYYNIAQKSRTLGFPAGVCPTVGIGGHFSGGGYGMMSRKFGLAIDHIIDARMVDVNGQILDRESMGEDLFWAIRGGGGASFGVILAWKINLVTVPENVTVFNITRTLEQNVTKLIHQWQYIADKIDENLSIRVTMSSVKSIQNGEVTLEVYFIAMYVGGINRLLEVIQESFPELGLVREECVEMSWIESILYIWRYPRNTPLDVLLDRTPALLVFSKSKSDYVKEPISEKGLLGLWEWLYEQVEISDLQFSPYGGRISEISESQLPFPHRAGNIYIIHYSVIWLGDEQQAHKHMNWIRGLYKYMGPYVSTSPRGAYLNYRDLDLGVNNKGNTSYTKASIWGKKYFKNNFDRLVHVKTKVDPANFFRNEQSIPSLATCMDKFKLNEVIEKRSDVKDN